MTGPNADELARQGLTPEPEEDSVSSDESPDDTPEVPDGDEPEDDTEDEPGPDESGEQGDESEEESEEVEKVESTDEADETDNPLLALQRRADEAAQTNAKLVDLISRSQQAKPEQPKPKADDFADVPDELLKLAMMGMVTPEALARYPKETVERTRVALEAHTARQLRYLRNPDALLQDMQAKIEELVNARVRPIAQDFHQRKADELAAKFFHSLDKNVHPRFREVFSSLNGSDSGDWTVVARNMEIANKLVKAEILEKQGKAVDQKKSAKKAQKQAAGGGKLTGKKPSNGAPVDQGGRPKMVKGESIVDYALRLKASGKF